MTSAGAPVYRGGCRCGAVRYTATGTPINQLICHCRLCQKAIGAAFNARILFHLDAVALSGNIAVSPSSPDLERGFCAACGTTLFSRRPSNARIGLTTGSLDDPTLFEPEAHIYTASMQPWIKLADGLPRYAEAMPLP